MADLGAVCSACAGPPVSHGPHGDLSWLLHTVRGKGWEICHQNLNMFFYMFKCKNKQTGEGAAPGRLYVRGQQHPPLLAALHMGKSCKPCCRNCHAHCLCGSALQLCSQPHGAGSAEGLATLISSDSPCHLWGIFPRPHLTDTAVASCGNLC